MVDNNLHQYVGEIICSRPRFVVD